jgi:hypothetical protein
VPIRCHRLPTPCERRFRKTVPLTWHWPRPCCFRDRLRAPATGGDSRHGPWTACGLLPQSSTEPISRVHPSTESISPGQASKELTSATSPTTRTQDGPTGFDPSPIALALFRPGRVRHRNFRPRSLSTVRVGRHRGRSELRRGRRRATPLDPRRLRERHPREQLAEAAGQCRGSTRSETGDDKLSHRLFIVYDREPMRISDCLRDE